MSVDPSVAYRAVRTRDRRFDGTFYAAVRTTGIYCRPGCPARTPAPQNLTYYPTSAAAQRAGYRACKRCLPEAAPGSPLWNLRADTVGAAMRHIDDGVVDREGARGLAARLGYSTRHLNRLLRTEVGAGPVALARAHRARTAHLLLTGTDLPAADVAFAAGFTSIRAFNETMQAVFALSPTALRARAHARPTPELPTDAAQINVQLPVREPFNAMALGNFLGERRIAGIEDWDGATYRRSLDLPHGQAVVSLLLRERPSGAVPVTWQLEDLADLGPALERTRRILDADADPLGIANALGEDPLLAPLVQAEPGLRLPGAPPGIEILIRAVYGQQISLAAARAGLAHLVRVAAEPLRIEASGLSHVFPTAAAVAAVATQLPGPRRRQQCLLAVAEAAATLDLSGGGLPAQLREQLLQLPGIGPWSAEYVLMRLLGYPDAFLPTDLGLRRAAIKLGLDPSAAALSERGAQWRPFRSYAQMHLWHFEGTSR